MSAAGTGKAVPAPSAAKPAARPGVAMMMPAVMMVMAMPVTATFASHRKHDFGAFPIFD
jgi:hypothetical protein